VCLPSSNTWLTSRVCGTFKERTTHPCQLALPILERIILSTSNPGDMVCDPMSGSFTAGEAALKHGRSFVGIELSENYVKGIGVPRLRKYE
jgi:DNA modification methylase